MVCTKQKWHSLTDCEDSEIVEAREYRKLKSDLFRPSGSVPAVQSEIMVRNASVSPFLRLPPEIRCRIYGFVLGGQQLWIDCTPSRMSVIRHDTHTRKVFIEKRKDRSNLQPSRFAAYDQEAEHSAGHFYHVNVDESGESQGFDLRLLLACRQIFTETALLPNALNKFTFSTDEVRKAFEKTTRPGKKLVQKKAIGKYEIMEQAHFQLRAINTSVPRWYSRLAEVLGWTIAD